MSETPENAQPLAQFDPRSTRRTAEDDRAWAQLYASVGQASTAEEVVKQLDADAQTRRSHLALYLRAKTTLNAGTDAGDAGADDEDVEDFGLHW